MLYNLELVLNHNDHQLLVLEKISKFGKGGGRKFESFVEWEVFKKDSIKRMIGVDVDVSIKKCFHIDSIEFLFDIYYKNMLVAKDCSNLIDYLEIKKAVDLCEKYKISSITIIDNVKIVAGIKCQNIEIESSYYDNEERNKILINDILINDIAIALAKKILEGNSYD